MRRILPQLTAAMAMGRRVDRPSDGTPGAVKCIQVSIASFALPIDVRSALVGEVIGVDTRDFELRPREVELDFHSGLDIREARGLRLTIQCGQSTFPCACANQSMLLCCIRTCMCRYLM